MKQADTKIEEKESKEENINFLFYYLNRKIKEKN